MDGIVGKKWGMVPRAELVEGSTEFASRTHFWAFVCLSAGGESCESCSSE